jgi:hypothetical protein
MSRLIGYPSPYANQYGTGSVARGITAVAITRPNGSEATSEREREPERPRRRESETDFGRGGGR